MILYSVGVGSSCSVTLAWKLSRGEVAEDLAGQVRARLCKNLGTPNLGLDFAV